MNNGNISERFRKDFGKEIFQLLQLINKNPHISAKELAEHLEKSSRTIENYLSKLKKGGIITRKGPKLGGYWQINYEYLKSRK